MRLKDKIAIVTGAGSGFGEGIAKRFAQEGCKILVNDINVEGGERVAREVNAGGGKAAFFKADVAKGGDWAAMLKFTLDTFGGLTTVVNNAGTTKVAFNHADLAALSGSDFQHVYAVNVIGAFQMIRAVEPAMRRQGGGAVVNVSSIAAVMGIGTSVAYAASKGALNTMTLSLARALGPQIRVNAVCPGFVETRWLQEAIGPGYEGAKARYMSNAALQKVCTPDDVARAVLWLLEGSELVTGEFIIVDGGAHLGGSPTKAR